MTSRDFKLYLKNKVKMMSTLYLIRHGQASFGMNNYDRLSLTGLKQSRILGNYLNRINLHFDAIYCGTIERQVKTAAEYYPCCAETDYPAPEIIHDKRFNEFDGEGVLKILLPVLLTEQPRYRFDSDNLLKDRGSFQRIFEAVMSMWASGKYDMKGVVTWDEFTKGVNSAVNGIMNTHTGGKNVAVFTSGGPISVVVQSVLNLTPQKSMDIRDMIVNTSITRFRYSQERFMISSFNEYPHLEESEDKNIITYR